MTKQELITAVKAKGFKKLPKGMSIKEALGNVGDKYLRDEEYDAKMMHPGLGAPDCYCHTAPPCDNCIVYTNDGIVV